MGVLWEHRHPSAQYPEFTNERLQEVQLPSAVQAKDSDLIGMVVQRSVPREQSKVARGLFQVESMKVEAPLAVLESWDQRGSMACTIHLMSSQSFGGDSVVIGLYGKRKAPLLFKNKNKTL